MGGDGGAGPGRFFRMAFRGSVLQLSAIRKGTGWSGLGTQAGEWDKFRRTVAKARV